MDEEEDIMPANDEGVAEEDVMPADDEAEEKQQEVRRPKRKVLENKVAEKKVPKDEREVDEVKKNV
jgi:hypothetical protein